MNVPQRREDPEKTEEIERKKREQEKRDRLEREQRKRPKGEDNLGESTAKR